MEHTLAVHDYGVRQTLWEMQIEGSVLQAVQLSEVAV